MLPIFVGHERSKDDALEQVARRKTAMLQYHGPDESYISLTGIVRAHSNDAPGYVTQSWLRSGNTLAFLNLWARENNTDYFEGGYKELIEKKKTASFTLTPKLWVSQTNAISIVSRQGKSGGTLAHPMIGGKLAPWLTPEFKMLLLNLSLNREQLK